MCHNIHVEVRRQLVGVSSYLAPCGLLVSDSACQAGKQAPLLTELSAYSVLFVVLFSETGSCYVVQYQTYNPPVYTFPLLRVPPYPANITVITFILLVGIPLQEKLSRFFISPWTHH